MRSKETVQTSSTGVFNMPFHKWAEGCRWKPGQVSARRTACSGLHDRATALTTEKEQITFITREPLKTSGPPSFQALTQPTAPDSHSARVSSTEPVRLSVRKKKTLWFAFSNVVDLVSSRHNALTGLWDIVHNEKEKMGCGQAFSWWPLLRRIVILLRWIKDQRNVTLSTLTD